MSETTPNELFALQQNCHFWVIYLPSIALSIVFGAYLKKYGGERGKIAAIYADLKRILHFHKSKAEAKKRGELEAINAGFAEIKKQVRETTIITEQVRSKVDHADWVAREWKTIRRVKLEELVQSAISVRHWTNKDLSLDRQDRQNAKSESCPAYHAAMIARLYFPGIQKETTHLVEAVSDAQAWQSNKIVEIYLQSRDEQQKQRANPWLDPKVLFERNEYFKCILKAIKAVEEKAAEIMCDFAK
ncbi:MAG: hypothetical protein D3922_00955 [Candidatus Electrothrix sp. AR1]|nr:hypothetical protein [Candidatus Electrothrix sp. AR1]